MKAAIMMISRSEDILETCISMYLFMYLRFICVFKVAKITFDWNACIETFSILMTLVGSLLAVFMINLHDWKICIFGMEMT